MKLTTEIKEIIETTKNVYIDTESELYNKDSEDAIYGWKKQWKN